MKRITIYIFLLLFSSSPVFAWKSQAPTTHRPITAKAISLLSESDYPDIKKFGDVFGLVDNDISDWSSGVLDDEAAHGKNNDPDIIYFKGREDAIKFNGGPFEIWWKAIKEVKYPNLKFLGNQSAYYYIGLMCHLIEDQCVPPHAANISHGLDDKFEYWAWRGLGMEPTGGSVRWINKEPVRYYFDKLFNDGSIRVTQSQLTSWIYPKTGHIYTYTMIDFPYWKENQDPKWKYNGQQFFPDTGETGTGWGSYGGLLDDSDKPKPEDIYFHYDIIGGYLVPHNESPEIVENQLNEAVSFTAGMLQAISKSLPPLVKDLKVSSSTDEIPIFTCGKEISFKILENRTSKVNIFISVNNRYDPNPPVGLYPAPPADGIFPPAEPEPSSLILAEYNYDLLSGNNLPYEKTYTFKWDGNFIPKPDKGDEPGGIGDGESYINNVNTLRYGENTLYVVVQDLDKNVSPNTSSSELIFNYPSPPSSPPSYAKEVIARCVISKCYRNIIKY